MIHQTQNDFGVYYLNDVQNNYGSETYPFKWNNLDDGCVATMEFIHF